MINTVLGTVSPEKLGVTLSHEHIACFSHNMKQTFGSLWFETEKLISAASNLLKEAKINYGIDTIIDGTPNNLGRDIGIIKQVSLLSGVNIAVSSGMYYSEEAFLADKSAEIFSEFFIEECINGISGTDVKPALLKCATDTHGFTDINIMFLNTMAITQNKTGLPLYAHAAHSIKTGLRQLDIFEQKGVGLNRVIIGHASDTDDLDYLIQMLKRGCYLSFDRLRPDLERNKKQAKILCLLLEKGWEEKILLSHDNCVFIDFNVKLSVKSKDGNLNSAADFTFLHRDFIPLLNEYNIPDKLMSKMLVTNPSVIFNT